MRDGGGRAKGEGIRRAERRNRYPTSVHTHAYAPSSSSHLVKQTPLHTLAAAAPRYPSLPPPSSLSTHPPHTAAERFMGVKNSNCNLHTLHTPSTQIHTCSSTLSSHLSTPFTSPTVGTGRSSWIRSPSMLIMATMSRSESNSNSLTASKIFLTNGCGARGVGGQARCILGWLQEYRRAWLQLSRKRGKGTGKVH